MAATGGAGTGPATGGGGANMSNRSSTPVAEIGEESSAALTIPLPAGGLVHRHSSLQRKKEKLLALVAAREPVKRVGLGELVGEKHNVSSFGFDPYKIGIDEKQELVLAGYGEHSIYHIKEQGTNKILRVRKIEKQSDERKGQYDATVKEAKVYNTLVSSTGDYVNHLFPFRGSYPPEPTGVVLIDFDYIEGVTFEEYITPATEEYITPATEEYITPATKKGLIIAAIAHLKWLLANGFTHGDVKWDNFFIDVTGKTYIFDFGKSNLPTSSSVDTDIKALLKMIPEIDEIKTFFNLNSTCKSKLAGLIPRTSNLAMTEEDRLKTNKPLIQAYGMCMYDKLLELLSGSQGGGRRKPNRKTRHRRNRNKRRTHKSIPRIMR